MIQYFWMQVSSIKTSEVIFHGFIQLYITGNRRLEGAAKRCHVLLRGPEYYQSVTRWNKTGNTRGSDSDGGYGWYPNRTVC